MKQDASLLAFPSVRHLSTLICLVTVTFFLSYSATARPTVHGFLIFCDAYPGAYGGINTSVTTDGYIVKSTLRDNINESSWGVSLRIEEISGVEATSTNIIERFVEFSKEVVEGDTLFVHFSGHGVIEDTTTNEQMLLGVDEQLFSRQALADLIESLPAQLKILITDCCSSYPFRQIAEGPDEVNPWNSYYHLFRLHEGFVNITAAQPGEDAYGTDRGGYLTVNLNSDMKRYKSWDKVFQRTKIRVFQETSDEIRDSEGDPQTPLAYSLGRRLFDESNVEAGVPEAVRYVFPDSADRVLTSNDLAPLGLKQLYFARNEIFARHGFDFSTPLLQYYFGDRSWYTLIEGEKSPPLSEIEKQNLALIGLAEKGKGGPFIPEDIYIPGLEVDERATPDIFPYSSTEKLSRVAVQSLSLQELSLARNEIFARYGYPFQSATLQDYFSRKGYYRRDEGSTDPSFTTVEELNIWLIEKIERLKGGPYSW